MTAAKAASTKTTAAKTAAKKPAAKKPEATPIKVVPLKPGDVKLNHMMHQNWACFAPSDYTTENLEDPKVWSFMAPKFKDLDHIRITAEDGSYVAFGIIRRPIGMEVSVQIYDRIQLQEEQFAREIEIEGYIIKHLGAVRRFCVINKESGQPVKENFQTQMSAMKYVTELIQAA